MVRVPERKKSGGSRVRRGTNETFPTPRGDSWVVSHNSPVGGIRNTGHQGGSQHLVPRNSPRAIRVQSEKRLHGGRLKPPVSECLYGTRCQSVTLSGEVALARLCADG